MQNSAYDPAVVSDLLDKLVEEQKDLFWNLRCSYANGQDQTILVATIYEGECHKVKSMIAFHSETGRIKNIRYRGYKQPLSGHIIDVLLDLLHFEKYRLLESA